MFDADGVADDDNLDMFSNEFFGIENEVEGDDGITPEAETDEVETEEVDETVTEAEEAEDESHEEESDDGRPEEPKKKRTVQDRIDELTREKYEALRRENEALKRIADLEAASKPRTQPEATETPKDIAPDPEAKGDDGEPKYPLGEFDPQYIRDLARFTIKQEQEAAKEYREKEERERQVQAQRDAAQTAWLDKLNSAQEEIPDVKDKIGSLVTHFEGIDQTYGQYLVDVVMSLDNGPQVLAYLADNPEAADKIIRSGAASATVSLGRLDARMTKPAKEEVRKVPTKAPEPPTPTRGSGGRFVTSADTDDLDAFEKVFFKKKGK